LPGFFTATCQWWPGVIAPFPKADANESGYSDRNNGKCDPFARQGEAFIEFWPAVICARVEWFEPGKSLHKKQDTEKNADNKNHRVCFANSNSANTRPGTIAANNETKPHYCTAEQGRP
jgi:hypothetical protein